MLHDTEKSVEFPFYFRKSVENIVSRDELMQNPVGGGAVDYFTVLLNVVQPLRFYY